MSQIEMLRETRGTALAECQRLVDGARAEDRDLNDAERRVFEEHRQLAQDVTERLEDIDERDKAAERSGRMFDMVGIRQGGRRPAHREHHRRARSVSRTCSPSTRRCRCGGVRTRPG